MDDKDWEREAATEAALQALELLEEFNVDIRATARVSGSAKIMAVDMESACKKVLAMDLSGEDIDYQFEDNSDLEGDYIAYVSDDHNQVEMDLTPKGEPFSWDAVDIVKELAKIDGPTVDYIEELNDLIAKARRACGKVD